MITQQERWTHLCVKIGPDPLAWIRTILGGLYVEKIISGTEYTALRRDLMPDHPRHGPLL